MDSDSGTAVVPITLPEPRDAAPPAVVLPAPRPDEAPSGMPELQVSVTEFGTEIRELLVLPEPLLEPAWRLYLSAFEELRAEAANRHVMYRSEFDAEMADTRVRKFLISRDGEMVALGAWTTDLEAVPLIAPEFYAKRYPEHYAAKRLYYVAFIAVSPAHQRAGAVSQLMRRMTEEVTARRGVLLVDVCNVRRTAIPRAGLRIMRQQVGDVELRLLDEQSFWALEVGPQA